MPAPAIKKQRVKRVVAGWRLLPVAISLAMTAARALYSLPMQDFAHTVACYADIFGVPRAMMAKQFRYQGEADQLPRGGRGQRVPKWEAKDYAFAILGAVSNQTIDAVEAARTLYGLTCCTNELTNSGAGDHSGIPPIPRGTRFGGWYTQEIKTFADLIEAGHVFEVEADPCSEPRQVIMSLNPPQAVVVRHVIGADRKPIPGHYYSEYFAGPDPSTLLGKNTPPHSRQTHITDQVLIMAGTLLAASRAKRSGACRVLGC